MLGVVDKGRIARVQRLRANAVVRVDATMTDAPPAAEQRVGTSTPVSDAAAKEAKGVAPETKPTQGGGGGGKKKKKGKK